MILLLSFVMFKLNYGNLLSFFLCKTRDDSLPGATLTDDSSASTYLEEVDKYQQRHYVLTDRTIVDRVDDLKEFQYQPTMKRREAVQSDPQMSSSKIGGGGGTTGVTSSCLKRRESSSSNTKIAARDQAQVFERAGKDGDNSPRLENELKSNIATTTSSSRKISVGSHMSPSSKMNLNLKDAKKKLRKLREAETKGRKKATMYQSPTRTCDLPSAEMTSSTNKLPADLPTVIGLPPSPFARRSKSSNSATKLRREKKSTSGTSSKYTRKLSGSSNSVSSCKSVREPPPQLRSRSKSRSRNSTTKTKPMRSRSRSRTPIPISVSSCKSVRDKVNELRSLVANNTTKLDELTLSTATSDTSDSTYSNSFKGQHSFNVVY